MQRTGSTACGETRFHCMREDHLVPLHAGRPPGSTACGETWFHCMRGDLVPLWLIPVASPLSSYGRQMQTTKQLKRKVEVTRVDL